MNLFLIINFKTIGTRFKLEKQVEYSADERFIFVSNHQSMYDIPFLVWMLRQHHPKFIAKKELGKGLPSISYALRHMGSVLINRKDPEGAVTKIKEFAKSCLDRSFSACIFPEGTRARDGKMKRFKVSGLKVLLKEMPNTRVVPVAINGSWELLRYHFKPVPFGVTVNIKFMEPLSRDLADEELIEKVEAIIRKNL